MLAFYGTHSLLSVAEHDIPHENTSLHQELSKVYTAHHTPVGCNDLRNCLLEHLIELIK